MIELSKWAFILKDFMGFSFRIFKVISPYQLIATFFKMGFDLVFRGFLSDKNFNTIVLGGFDNSLPNN
jgi:hypothetical protein